MDKEEIIKDENLEVENEMNDILEDEHLEILEYDIDEFGSKKSRYRGIRGKFNRVIDEYKKIKKNKIAGIIIQVVSSLIILGIAAFIGIFLAVGSKKGSPTHFATEYFDYYVNRNWKSMYVATDIKESKFINYESFKTYMRKNAINVDIKDYEFDIKEENDKFAYVDVIYREKKETTANTETAAETTAETVAETAAETTAETTAETVAETTVTETAAETTVAETVAETVAVKKKEKEKKFKYSMTLKIQDKKILLFYNTYKGFVDSYIINGCTIEAPEKFNIKFDGVSIKSLAKGKNKETGNIIYDIGRVFKGEHKITIESEEIDTTEKVVNWDKNLSTYVVPATDYDIKSEDKKAIQATIKDLIVGFYSSSLAETGIDELKPKILENPDVYKNMDEIYKTMIKDINKKDGTTLLTVAFKKFDSVYEDYKYRESVNCVINYTCDYTARKKRTVIDGVRKKYNGTNVGTAKVSFVFLNGVWTPTNIEMGCLDYSIENPEVKE